MSGRSCLTIAALLLAANVAVARIWYVPGDASTIQEGINSAAAGDTVEVAPGVYRDCSTLAFDATHFASRLVCVELKSGLYIRSATGTADCATIDAQSVGGVLFASGVTNVVVEGFTCRAGSSSQVWSGSGGGAYVVASNVVFRNCEFLENVSPDHGGAVHLALGATALFENCGFRDNAASSSGGGLYSTGSTLSLAGCSFIGNSLPLVGEFHAGGALQVSESAAMLTGCSFVGNSATTGGALAISSGLDHVMITDCDFVMNTADFGGAVSYRSSTPTTFAACRFESNTAFTCAGAIDSHGTVPSEIELVDCMFRDNGAPLGQDGHVWPTASLSLECCLTDEALWSNDGTLSLGFDRCFSPALTDVPGDQGGALIAVWNKHILDDAAAAVPVALYEVQRLEDVWVGVAEVAATAASSYSATVTTPDVFISGEAAPWRQYRVVAVSANAGRMYVSRADSGYSIDNLPPAAPPLALYDSETFRNLVWENPNDVDFAETCLYRGFAPGFEAGAPVTCSSTQHWYLETHLARYYYRARSFDIHGNASEWSNEVVGRWPTPVPQAVPTVLRLHPCQPNPFNPRTTIKYDLPEAGTVRLAVFDLAGRLVRTLVDESMPQGSHEAVWDGRDATGREVGSGTYLARLEFGGMVEVVRMGLVR